MVYGDLQFFDVVIFAVIAVFIIYRLRSVLGKRTGFQQKTADQRFVKNTMENWDDEVARQLPNFANGQGIVSGQITNLPLTVKIIFDADLVNSDLGDEDFINDVQNWKESEKTKKKKGVYKNFEKIFQSDQRKPN